MIDICAIISIVLKWDIMRSPSYTKVLKRVKELL